jgi:hypothetical protein
LQQARNSKWRPDAFSRQIAGWDRQIRQAKNRECRKKPEKALVMLSVWTAAINFVARYLPMRRNQFWPVVIWTYLHQYGRTCIIHSAGSIQNK